VLLNICGNGKPFLLVGNPDVRRRINSVQSVKRTKRDGNGIWPAFPFGKELTATTGTKLASQVIAGSKFSQLAGDGHCSFGKERPHKESGSSQPLTILAMTSPNIDWSAGYNIFHGSAKATSGSGFRGRSFHRRTFRITHGAHFKAATGQIKGLARGILTPM